MATNLENEERHELGLAAEVDLSVEVAEVDEVAEEGRRDPHHIHDHAEDPNPEQATVLGRRPANHTRVCPAQQKKVEGGG